VRYRVELGAGLMEQVVESFGAERSVAGAPDRYDFMGGPVAAATDLFRDFDSLPAVVGPAVRVATVVDPFFGAVTFTGVLVGAETVEIAGFVDDPEYWTVVDDDPDD
jgi:hypothetical protein